MRSRPIERVLAPVRTGTAALAIAVGLSLLLRIPLLATFRAAIVILAALEILSFGQRALSANAGVAPWIEIVVKLAVLALAYVAVSQ